MSNGEELSIQMRLLYDAELFAIAHEFGHVVINLSSGNPGELELGTSMAQSILRGVTPGLSDAAMTDRCARWGEETSSVRG